MEIPQVAERVEQECFRVQTVVLAEQVSLQSTAVVVEACSTLVLRMLEAHHHMAAVVVAQQVTAQQAREVRQAKEHLLVERVAHLQVLLAVRVQTV